MSVSINNTNTLNYNNVNEKNNVSKSKSIQNDKTVVKPDVKNNESKIEKLSSQGTSKTNISFLESKINDKPAINIPNAKAGDKYEVDGPLWYDGTAELKKYDSNSMEVKINMKASEKVLGVKTNIPYIIKDGKVNISVKLEKGNGNDFKLTTTDHNNSDKKTTQTVTSSGPDNNLTMSDKYGNKTTFNIKKNGNMSIKMAGAPFSIDLNKS